MVVVYARSHNNQALDDDGSRKIDDEDMTKPHKGKMRGDIEYRMR
jgi:hypothetical protein